MSHHLSARCHLEDPKGNSLRVVLVQRVPQGAVEVLVPSDDETLEGVVSSLILAGVPPQRIWPSRILVGSVVGVSAVVAVP